MASKLKKIFLSASIPLEESNPEYFESADNTAIRDAVVALAKVVLPKARLVWGGHPSITPLIQAVLSKQGVNIKKHVTLYQSNFFADNFPSENKQIEKLFYIDALTDRKSSLRLMRRKMIVENNFVAGIFIGGMKGVEDEFKLFRKSHPSAAIFPIASTGAAAKKLYFQNELDDKRLLNDFCYLPLFDELFEGILDG